MAALDLALALSIVGVVAESPLTEGVAVDAMVGPPMAGVDLQTATWAVAMEGDMEVVAAMEDTAVAMEAMEEGATLETTAGDIQEATQGTTAGDIQGTTAGDIQEATLGTMAGDIQGTTAEVTQGTTAGGMEEAMEEVNTGRVDWSARMGWALEKGWIKMQLCGDRDCTYCWVLLFSLATKGCLFKGVDSGLDGVKVAFLLLPRHAGSCNFCINLLKQEQ